MKYLDLAIIIPTLNEEKYIGKLLDSISIQTSQPKEVVVVDAQSPDNTILEVQKRQKKLPQLKYYQIPKYTISRQRNYGIKNTAAKHLLFLDADMQLREPHTLEKYIAEVEEKKPNIASALNLPDTNYWKDNLFFRGMDLTFKALKPIWPMAQGMNMYLSRDAYDKFGGFDEEIKIGEDHELVQRITKNKGTFLYLKKPILMTSVRRLREVGTGKFILLMLISLGLVIMFGYKKNPITKKYELGNHS